MLQVSVQPSSPELGLGLEGQAGLGLGWVAQSIVTLLPPSEVIRWLEGVKKNRKFEYYIVKHVMMGRRHLSCALLSKRPFLTV